MIFIIDRKDSVLRFSSGSLQLERNGEKIQRLPVKQIEQVIIYGNALVESSALRALSAESVPTVFLSLRGKPTAAFVATGLAIQLPFRKLQHRAATEQMVSIELAKWFLQLKFHSYALPLQLLENNFPKAKRELDQFKERSVKALENIKIENQYSSILGIEGQLAGAWFSLLAKLLPEKWKFNSRNRRPPEDPVNAMLSLGYTLVLSEIRSALAASGLDPSLGFLHNDTPGRDSLALDFNEIYRAAVDYFVIELLLSESVDKDSFYFRQKEGCRLSKSARPVFFKNWANFRQNWPRAIAECDKSQLWPEGILNEQINGHIMQFRQQLKEHSPCQ